MKAKDGCNFYDNSKVFNCYQNLRRKKNNLNDLLEQPIFISLLPDLSDKNILDIGSGDGTFDRLLIESAQNVFGIDGSEKMIDVAKSLPKIDGLEFKKIRVENFEFKAESYDLVISRLVFHYIKNFDLIIKKIRRSLKNDGLLIFSVEHPFLTAGPTLWDDPEREQKCSWQISKYFDEGARNILWFGECVQKYHRTVETYFKILSDNNFVVEKIRESKPDKKMVKDKKIFKTLCSMPFFLFFRARKRK